MKKVFIMLGLVGFATLAQAATTTGGEEKKEVTAVAARLSVEEVAEMMGQEEVELQAFFGTETQTVKVFNAQDELVAEGTLNAFGQPEEPELVEALRKADILMTLGNTQYYRLD
ncbi:MAG TPA: hypothetical protein DCE41_00785 [Cytophagales bacterium]|nr:hypothetical protein [Cytophagales bacterium]HAA21934.1 hypothetical protein [Cytophagales bacterium]HAP61368.1 hypothetical protein [Cytophagales bacterium]